MMMRKHKIEGAYEKLKELTRGAEVTPESIKTFLKNLDLPENDKKRLEALSPENYIGYAEYLAKDIKNNL